MKVRYLADQVRYQSMATEELRETFLVAELFQPDQVVLHYTGTDRCVVGSAVPGKQTLRLEGGRELASDFFTQRREVGVMQDNEEDFTACLGFEVEGVDEGLTNLEIAGFKQMIETAVEHYPNFKTIATTLRKVKTATVNDWGAICWMNGNFHEAIHRPDLEIMNRASGGDSFASGFIYGLMELQDPAQAVNYGAALGALAMTTPGDTSMLRTRR